MEVNLDEHDRHLTEHGYGSYTVDMHDEYANNVNEVSPNEYFDVNVRNLGWMQIWRSQMKTILHGLRAVTIMMS